jgi:hypothetical protein
MQRQGRHTQKMERRTPSSAERSYRVRGWRMAPRTRACPEPAEGASGAPRNPEATENPPKPMRLEVWEKMPAHPARWDSGR